MFKKSSEPNRSVVKYTMEAKIGSSSSSSSSESILQTLSSRGWFLRDTEQIQGLIAAHHGSRTVDSIESELLNMDLRSIGAKCLPQPSLLPKTPRLQTPIVLQVCSSRDISRSSIAESLGNSSNRRLLRLKLTDGHSEITAIEHSHVPSLPDDVIPGTKVRLQNRADIFRGIVCLNNKVITILGGTVQSLYEEWQMKRKYMDISSNSSKINENALGYPPFEKFQVRGHARATGVTSTTSARGISGSSSNVSRTSVAEKGESSNSDQRVTFPSNKAVKASVTDDMKQLHDVGDNNEKQTQQLTRQKVAASIPVQNQEAAQKLLQKINQPNYNNRNSRNHRPRGRFREEEESNFLTLDEWERRKHGVELPPTHFNPGTSQDEDLARQLQEQFDLEDVHEQTGPQVTEAKNITMSMFNFERNEANAFGRGGSRGRGRGGRGRRGRGRGRF